MVTNPNASIAKNPQPLPGHITHTSIYILTHQPNHNYRKIPMNIPMDIPMDITYLVMKIPSFPKKSSHRVPPVPLSTSPQWHPKASEQLLALKAPSWQGKSWASAVGNGIKSWKRRERKQQELGALLLPTRINIYIYITTCVSISIIYIYIIQYLNLYHSISISLYIQRCE